MSQYKLLLHFNDGNVSTYNLPEEVSFGLNQSMNYIQGNMTKNLSLRKYSTDIPNDIFSVIYDEILSQGTLNILKISFLLVENENSVIILNEAPVSNIEFQHNMSNHEGPGSIDTDTISETFGIYLSLTFNLSGM